MGYKTTNDRIVTSLRTDVNDARAKIPIAESSWIPLLVWQRPLKRSRPLFGTCRLRWPLPFRAYTRPGHRCPPLPRVFPSIPLQRSTMPARTVSGYLMVCYPPFEGRLHSHPAIAPRTFLVHNKWVALPRTFASLTLPHQDQCSCLRYNLRGLSPGIHRRSTCLPSVARPSPQLTIIWVSLFQPVRMITIMVLGNDTMEGPSNRPALATKNAWLALAVLACSILPDLRPPITMVV